MRKSLLILSFVGLIGSSVDARTLTPAEALARALDNGKTSAPHRAPLRKSPILTVGEQNSPSLYVFDQGNEGYLVVSADDVAAPVLGYSTTGSIDPDNMPDNLRWWLNQYKAEIEAATKNGTPAYSQYSDGDRAPIEPLLKTRWNQGEPYNNDCPQLAGNYTVTGCVATAMAQVMNYHEWPASFNADFSYTWATAQSQLVWKEDNVTFDWANMLDVYTRGQYDTTQAAAVAKLMKACGYSVNMNYDIEQRGGSGAPSISIPLALVNTFGYDKDAHIEFRSFYGLDEWETIIYNNLKECGPVIYSGANGSGAGHCFVCDGYQSDGYFHFNWGWSGVSDGYFRLTALDPSSQGIGGSTDGYNIGQDIVVGIGKPVSDSNSSYIVCEGQFSAEVTSNNVLSISGPFYNFSAVEFIGQLGLRLTDNDGKAIEELFLPLDTISPYSGYGGFSIELTLKAGDYRLYPVYKPYKGQSEIMPTPADHPGYIALHSNGVVITAEVPEVGAYAVEDLKFETPLYQGYGFVVTGNALWTGPLSVSQTIFGVLLTGTTSETTVAIGEQMAQEFSPNSVASPFEYQSSWIQTTPDYSTGIPEGSYYFAMAIADNNSPNGIRLICEPIQVSMLANPGKPVISSPIWSIANATSVTPDNIKVSMVVACSSGYFFNRIPVYVLGPILPGVTTYTPAVFYSDRISLTAGKKEIVDFTIQMPNALPGETYQAFLVNPVDNKELSANRINFTISNQTGISDIMTDTPRGVSASPNPAYDYTVITAGSEITRIDIASLSGSYVSVPVEIDGSSARIDVTGLATGLYIARVATANGVESVKIIKK